MFISNLPLKSFIQTVILRIQELSDAAAYHPKRQLFVMAALESAEYARQHMLDATSLDTTEQVLTFALRRCRIQGLHLEFGVFRGGTIRHIAKHRPGVVIHGFDSFRGLPEDWSGNSETFDVQGELPKVPANVKLHVGYFDATLPPFAEAHPGPVAFLHIDSDIYSSAKTILDVLAARIVPGTVIVFDEYFNYPGWQNHEIKAWKEFVADHQVEYQYLAFARLQVAVIVTAKGSVSL